MKRILRYACALPVLAFMVSVAPASAGQGGSTKGHGHSVGHHKGHGNSHGKSGGGGGGKSKGSPAPIAGLGIVALGALGVGTRKLRRQKPA